MLNKSYKIIVEENSCFVRIEGVPELERLEGVIVGEGIVFLGNSNEKLFVFNSHTGEMRKLVQANCLLVGDEDIDLEAISHVCQHGYNNASTKALKYGGLSRWGNFSCGITALSWTLYPDGMFFADEDGFGMEDNDEEVVYAIIDTHFNVIEPFRPIDDIDTYLKVLRMNR